MSTRRVGFAVVLGVSLSSLGCGGTSFACPEGFEMSADGRCVLPDAGSMPMADGGEGAPDAFAADLDAGMEQPDAYVATTDAAVEMPDAYVEVPDAYVPPPDACAYGTWYADSDGDGFGRASAPVSGCMQPSGTVSDATDCDDSSAARHPGASETCNVIDDNCNGTVDEGVLTTFYADCDDDQYVPLDAPTQQACSAPVVAPSACNVPFRTPRWITRAPTPANIDCGPNDARAHPGQTEWYSAPSFVNVSGDATSYDFDCSGTETHQLAAIGQFGTECSRNIMTGACVPATATWYHFLPGCGSTGTTYTCVDQAGVCTVRTSTTMRADTCH